MKPIYREKNLLDLLFGGFRSTLKGGPEPSNLEDLCLVNDSVKYFSKLCFGTIKKFNLN